MAGGPIFPYSAIPVTAGKVFPNVHLTVSNARYREGLGVMASLDGDAVWELHFLMPPTLPAGTAKLKLRGVTAGTEQAAKVNPKWKSVAVGEALGIAIGNYNAEGTVTVSFGSAADVDTEAEVTLDADTVVADEEICMLLTFETSGWTLAAVSTWLAAVIWE